MSNVLILFVLSVFPINMGRILLEVKNFSLIVIIFSFLLYSTDKAIQCAKQIIFRSRVLNQFILWFCSITRFNRNHIWYQSRNQIVLDLIFISFKSFLNVTLDSKDSTILILKIFVDLQFWFDSAVRLTNRVFDVHFPFNSSC